MSTAPDLAKDVETLKQQLAQLYVPKSFDNMMRKIGSIDKNVQVAQQNMSFCYYVSLFTFIIFLALLFIALYVLWRMNYFKFLLRNNRFSRFTRPRACFACHRSFHKSTTLAKPYLSSPELMDHVSAPLPRTAYTDEVSENDSDPCM